MPHPLEKRLQVLSDTFCSTWQKLGLDERFRELAKLEQVVAEPELWKDPERARAKNQALALLHERLDPWQLLKTQINDLKTFLALDSGDMTQELDGQLKAMEVEFADLRRSLRLHGKYDHGNAILRITAGAGGVEAMDWAGMLLRMYLRWAEQRHFKTNILDHIAGEEAGVKTAVVEITGADAYGLLRSEHGTHRLVRLSPFNADHLRQTSFARVEVLPVLSPSEAVKIDPKDLRIDVFHSGGHGGQSVNTTNSAVRITHLPTGTVVSIQNERSQLQNRLKAMTILQGKLQQMQDEQHVASLSDLRAAESASWGQQIRNYILQPYKLVKDTRTKYEEADPEAVLNGAIDGFIHAYLDSNPSD